MKAFPRLGLVGLLSIFPLGTSQSDPRTLEQEMKEVAELALRCGIREEVTWSFCYGPNRGANFRTIVEYTLNTHDSFSTILVEGYRQKELFFVFQDGNLETPPNNKIDKSDSLTVYDDIRGVSYSCVYGVKGHLDGEGRGCLLDEKELTSPRAEDVRRLLRKLKEKQYESCYVS